MTSESIGDRHLRAVDGLLPPDARRLLTVRILSRGAAGRIAGQHLILCLVNLLGRMADLVGRVELDLPQTPLRVVTPFESAPDQLPDAAAALVRWAVSDAVEVATIEGSAAPDIWLCVGEDVAAPAGAPALHAQALGWRAWVGAASHCPRLSRCADSPNPLGPFFAACLLAGEVFKRARGIRRGRYIDDFACSLWSGEQGDWSALVDGPEIEGLALPPFYLIGAGAVGQGLINLVGAACFASPYVVTIDDDRHDRTNLNRCFLAGLKDLEAHKVEAVRRFRRLAGVGGHDFPGTLADYLRHGADLRPDVAAAEREDRFDCVVSCVDKGSSRQDVQGLWPRFLLGGSTSGLSAKTNLYDLPAGTPCLGCHNPPEQDGDRLRKVEQRIRAMTQAQREAYLREAPDAPAILAYLANGERCGGVGEAEFRAFATRQAKEFSVSFVSMAASALLAARLFARLLFPTAPLNRLAPMTSIAFLNASIDHARLSVDPFCRRCGGDPAGRFATCSVSALTIPGSHG